jgi:hypothetical protein
MISVKPGASVRGLRPEMVLALVAADQVYGRQGVKDMVVTEGTGGKHGAGSLHYVGQAVDLRTSNVAAPFVGVIAVDLRAALGAEYDVVVESDHMHVEFQPK